jgi:hypothetical protein
MQIEYEISEQDFLDAQKLAMRKHPSRNSRLIFRLLPFWGLFLSLGMIWGGLKQGLSWNLLPGFLLGLLFLSSAWLLKLAQRKMYRQSPSLHGKRTMILNETGLSFSGPSFSSNIDWSFFQRFEEDDRVFLFWQSRQIFNIVPKRELSPGQISELRQAFTQNIVGKAE